MKYLKRMKNEGGFSLVELMTAVGIIGVMSSIAVPQYQKFRANAAQSEAQSNLSSIYTLQQLFFTENDYYSNALTGSGGLGFDTTGARYDYATTRWANDAGTTPGTDGNTNRGIFFKAVATAESALAPCSGGNVDKWCINEKKVLKNDGVAAVPCLAADSKFGGCT